MCLHRDKHTTYEDVKKLVYVYDSHEILRKWCHVAARKHMKKRSEDGRRETNVKKKWARNKVVSHVSSAIKNIYNLFIDFFTCGSNLILFLALVYCNLQV